MKKSLLILLIILFSASFLSLKAQLGINFSYQKNDFKTWNEVIESYTNERHTLLKNAYKIGLDYGFEMKMYRVSFYPEVSYSLSEETLINTRFTNPDQFDFKNKQYSFSFKTFIYPFDLTSKQSMQCPSFYRGMDKFTKGWFISVLPEINYSVKQLLPKRFGQDVIPTVEHSSLSFDFGIGTGIDIGITNNISITPLIMYAFTIGEKWDGLSQEFGQASYNDGTSASYVSGGIRLGFWF